MSKADEPSTAASMRPVSNEVVSKMLLSVQGQTDPKLMQQLGISYNTWRKIRSGDAIRSSVADRLEARLRQVDVHAARHTTELNELA